MMGKEKREKKKEKREKRKEKREKKNKTLIVTVLAAAISWFNSSWKNDNLVLLLPETVTLFVLTVWGRNLPIDSCRFSISISLALALTARWSLL